LSHLEVSCNLALLMHSNSPFFKNAKKGTVPVST
jgi:hypothetical protein